MKVLCFVLILANLVLFLWEYRSAGLGASVTVVQTPEPLILVDEAKASSKVKTNP